MERLIFEVGSYRHLSDLDVWRMPAAWLFRQFDLVCEARYRDTTAQVRATELGASRALYVLSGGKSPPPLPTYEQAYGIKSPDKSLSAKGRAFVDRMQRANRLGQYKETP